MPVKLIDDGFFRPTPRPGPAVHGPVSFVVCQAGSAAQANWFRGAITHCDGEPLENFVVVYLGDSAAALDNDRMSALRRELPRVFEDRHIVIASSDAEGSAQLHHDYRGDLLLRWAAVVSVVQAAAAWDETMPIRVTCDHHVVACRPAWDADLSQWRCQAELDNDSARSP